MSQSSTAFESDLELAFHLADVSAAVALDRFQKPLRSRSKSDGSIVTEADELAEDEIRRTLELHQPSDAMLGEERGRTGSSPRRWIVDAIDGTHNYANGSPDWGTLIALEVSGQVVCGVCNQPAHGRRYWAARGGGAFWTSSPGEPGQPLSVSGADDLDSARSFVPSPEWWRIKASDRIAAALLGATRPEAPQNHPALQVADGSIEVALFLGGGPWDLAAPSVIVEEAGGTFTDLSGQLTLDSQNGIFSNGRIHDALLSLIAE